MKIEVNSKGGSFELIINGEKILKSAKLSSVVSKIEQYLKMRFLKEDSSAFSRLGNLIR